MREVSAASTAKTQDVYKRQLYRIPEQMGEGHGDLCNIFYIIVQGHIADALQGVVQKVGIDLIPVGQDLSLFFGQLGLCLLYTS